jgi:Na+/proline symporter
MWGQPQALNRLMAARDETLQTARWLALVWTGFQLLAVLACGWSALLLFAGLDRPEHALLALATRPLPPWLSAPVVLAIAFTLVASIAGSILSLAAAMAVDLRRNGASLFVGWTKAAAALAAVIVIGVAVAADRGVIARWLFGYTTLGAVFGPLVLVRMSGKRIRPGAILGAMWAAFLLSMLFHALPDSPGDFLERVLPFVSALGIALTGGERRRNPDRADRAQETVHDRIPI